MGMTRTFNKWTKNIADAVENIPTAEEGCERLELLRSEGPTARAFTFARPFAPEEAGS